jgi:hypothetical protein
MKVDPTFSSNDCIRIFSQHLDSEEQADVLCYFDRLLTLRRRQITLALVYNLVLNLLNVIGYESKNPSMNTAAFFQAVVRQVIAILRTLNSLRAIDCVREPPDADDLVDAAKDISQTVWDIIRQ